jgi:TRAP-type uncharacterized transport system fused permease subunit
MQVVVHDPFRQQVVHMVICPRGPMIVLVTQLAYTAVVVRASIAARIYFFMLILRGLKAVLKSEVIKFFTIQLGQLLELLVREP